MGPVIPLTTVVLDKNNLSIAMDTLFELYNRHYIVISNIQCTWANNQMNVVQKAGKSHPVEFQYDADRSVTLDVGDIIQCVTKGCDEMDWSVALDIGVQYYPGVPMIWDQVVSDRIEQRHPRLLRPYHLITGQRQGTMTDFDLEALKTERPMVVFNNIVGRSDSNDYIRAIDHRQAKEIARTRNNSAEWAANIYPHLNYQYPGGEHSRRIVSAANRFKDFYMNGKAYQELVIPSARHWSPAMRAIVDILPDGFDKSVEYTEGFIDQYDHFWDRKMALEIALYSDQLIMKTGGTDILFSEDLY